MMASPQSFRTPYEKRVALVRDTIKDNSKLGDEDAGKLAVRVLHVLDAIPEKMR